jgi:hypothetical protein
MVALRSRQKPRFLPAEAELMSEKAPQATFSHRLVRTSHPWPAPFKRMPFLNGKMFSFFVRFSVRSQK